MFEQLVRDCYLDFERSRLANTALIVLTYCHHTAVRDWCVCDFYRHASGRQVGGRQTRFVQFAFRAQLTKEPCDFIVSCPCLPRNGARNGNNRMPKQRVATNSFLHQGENTVNITSKFSRRCSTNAASEVRSHNSSLT